MNICINSEATNRLAKFFKNDAMDRWICFPSLNRRSLSLPTNDYSFDTEEMSLTVGDGKLRILTDITNKVEWELLQKLVSTKNAEIRHCKYIDMTLFLLPQKDYSITLVKEYNENFSIGYDEDEIVLFESDAFDSINRYRLFHMFEELWDWSETITVQKLEMFMNLVRKAPYFSLIEDSIPAGTYLLLSSKEEISSFHGVFCSRIKGNFSFLQEDKTVSFPYIMGLDIPKETKYIIHCELYEYDEIEVISIKRIYAVDASSPLDFDDFLWKHVEAKKGEFAMIKSNYLDKDYKIYPTRDFHFDLPSPEMAARKMFMLSKVNCSHRKLKKLEKKLNTKMKVEKEFKESVLHKSFIKVK